MATRAKHFQHKAPAGKACAIGAFVPDLTKCAFQKYGFSTAKILVEWAAIVGSDLAAATRPEKLKWPRNAEAYNSFEGQRQGREGAILLLRVEPALALDIQYQSSAIKERINAYFGYFAVHEIRLLQAPLGKVQAQPDRTFKAQLTTAPLHGNSAGQAEPDDPLSSALARLQSHISHAA